MTLPAVSLRSAIRPLASVIVLSSALVFFLNPALAYAMQNSAVGPIVVERGDEVSKVSTGFGDILVLGEVEGDVNSASGNVEVRGPVEGSVRSGMGDIRITAPVGKDVDAGVGDVYVDSEVDGDISVERGDLVFGPNAQVEGDVFCGSGSFKAHPASRVSGETMFGPASDLYKGEVSDDSDSDFFGIAGWMLSTALFVALTLLVSVLMPRSTVASSRMVGQSPVWSLLAGLGSVVAALVGFMLLLLSGIGIPVLILLAPAYLAFLFFGTVVVALFVGRKVVFLIGGYRHGNMLAAMIGAVAVSALYLLPLGLLLISIVSLLGAGAAIMALFSRRRPGAYTPRPANRYEGSHPQ